MLVLVQDLFSLEQFKIPSILCDLLSYFFNDSRLFVAHLLPQFYHCRAVNSRLWARGEVLILRLGVPFQHILYLFRSNLWHSRMALDLNSVSRRFFNRIGVAYLCDQVEFLSSRTVWNLFPFPEESAKPSFDKVLLDTGFNHQGFMSLFNFRLLIAEKVWCPVCAVGAGRWGKDQLAPSFEGTVFEIDDRWSCASSQSGRSGLAGR